MTPTRVNDLSEVTWEAEKGANYSLILIDFDPTRVNRETKVLLQRFVFGIPGNDFQNEGAFLEFAIGGSPKRTGFYRYLYFVLKQPKDLESISMNG